MDCEEDKLDLLDQIDIETLLAEVGGSSPNIVFPPLRKIWQNDFLEKYPFFNVPRDIEKLKPKKTKSNMTPLQKQALKEWEITKDIIIKGGG